MSIFLACQALNASSFLLQLTRRANPSDQTRHRQKAPPICFFCHSPPHTASFFLQCSASTDMHVCLQVLPPHPTTLSGSTSLVKILSSRQRLCVVGWGGLADSRRDWLENGSMTGISRVSARSCCGLSCWTKPGPADD